MIDNSPQAHELATMLAQISRDEPVKDGHRSLQFAMGEALLELLRRTGWKKLVTDADMPEQYQTVLIWEKGGEHPSLATCNVDYRHVKYFILANSGIAKRAMAEITHWMPAPIGPIE